MLLLIEEIFANDEKWWIVWETRVQKTKNENYSHLCNLAIHYLKLAERGKSDFLHMNGCVFDNRNMNIHSEDREEQLRE